MAYMSGLATKTIRNKAIPRTVHKKSPCLKEDFPFSKFPSPSASATNGVMAVEKPIPNDMAINIKLFPRETAASSAVPNCPTMMLSTNATTVCPNIPKITGVANDRLYLNSLVYAERKVLALIQLRKGPNIVGPFGLLQSFADAIKLLTKENIIANTMEAHTSFKYSF